MKGLMFRKPCQHLLRMLSSDCVRSCAFLKSGCFHVLLKQHCFMKSLRLKLTEQLSFEVEIHWAPFICNLKLDTTTWSWIDNLLIYLSSFVFTFCIVLVRTMADSDDSDNTMTTRRWCSRFCKSWCGVCYGCRSLATSGNRTDTRHARAGETAQRNSAGSQRYCICELCLLAPFFSPMTSQLSATPSLYLRSSPWSEKKKRHILWKVFSQLCLLMISPSPAPIRCTSGPCNGR